MRLHLLSVPHSVTTLDWSHCAFTQKVYKLSRMMVAQGFEVLHYGVDGADSGATADVVLMGQDEHQELLGHPYDHSGRFYGEDAKDGSPCYRQFNLYARDELKERVQPGDLILLPFGFAHAAAIRDLPVLGQGAGAVESGIGYFDCLLPWRIYESEAVRHAAMAKDGRFGVHESSRRLEYVIPNSYDVNDWPEGKGGGAVVFLGRMTEGKGIRLIFELARQRPDVPFRMAGQGDISNFGPVPDNVEVLGPINAERAAYLGDARAIIAPSRYIEPFCGVTVEAALCGTPAIASNFGAFTETIEEGVTGFRCQTTDEWLAAIDNVTRLDRSVIRARAQRRYALDAVGTLYAQVLPRFAAEAVAGRFPTSGWST